MGPWSSQAKPNAQNKEVRGVAIAVVCASFSMPENLLARVCLVEGEDAGYFLFIYFVL